MCLQIRSLTEQDLIGFWSQYVQRLRELLQAGSHPSGDQHQIVQKIHTLQREAMILHIRWVVPLHCVRVQYFSTEHPTFFTPKMSA